MALEVAMRRDNAVPDSIVVDEHSKRQTVELCGDDADGLRCTLMKDHTGPHECLATRGPMRWARSGR
jgi:hypothetical protein